MFSKLKTFDILFILFSILAVVSSFLKLNMAGDIFLKVSPLLLIMISYFLKVKKVNLICVLLVLLLTYSNSLLRFGDKFLNQIILISTLEKLLLLIVVFNYFKKEYTRSLINFSLLVFMSSAPLYYFFNRSIHHHNTMVFITYIFTCLAISFSYVAVIKINSKKMIYYFLSILLFSFAEVFFGIYFYFDPIALYLASGFFILSFARHTLYGFMLE